MAAVSKPPTKVDKRAIRNAKARIMSVFTDGDTAARVAFVERCPDNPLKRTVLDSVRTGYPETQYMALCMLADPYCRGLDSLLGIAIAEAVYEMSQRAFAETKASNYLDTAAQAAVTCLLGYNSLGWHEIATRFGETVVGWLDSEGYTAQRASLLMSRIDAHLNPGEFDEAGALLDAAEKIAIPPNQSADQRRLQDLRRTFDKIARRDATELPKAPQSDADTLAAGRKDLGEMIQHLKSLMTGQEGAPIQNFVSALAAQVKESAATSQAAWAIESQPLRDTLTEIISGGAGGMTQLRNRNRLINAAVIFGDPVKGHDPSAIEEAVAVLLEARMWAKTNDCARDEADALWSLYLGYSRTERPEQAIEALQALRANLEARRAQIADPRERAGPMLDYPYMFPALCRMLCGAQRATELLDAMEGAKGRYLSDVLTRASGHVVADAQFRAPTEDLARLLRPLKAHYLSYFVDDDETYVALVAKDGSVHCHAIPIGREQLRSLIKSTNPKKWGPQAGFFGAQETAPPPMELSGLVQWLEPLVEVAILQPGDHLCYCPDDLLHLMPLHYLPLAGSPIVRHFSISRIHSAAALLAILRRSAERPARFVAAHVPVQQDLADADKVSALARAPRWLAEHSVGTTLVHEGATLQALAGLDLTDRVVHFATHGVFPQNDLAGHNPNPFYASGVAFAKDGALPSAELVAEGKADDTLLTPERALTLHFDRSHVTLQACVSGLAKEGIGGDALGLELALLLAGAQSLLTTHWNVSAAESADFTIRFYRKWLLENATRAQAWQAAVFELMDQEHPPGIPGEYYWAGFSLSGDFR